MTFLRVPWTKLRRNQAVLSPANSVLSALGSGIILLIATRRHELGQIAGYTTGASLAALASVVLAGGTTINYVNATEIVKSHIRQTRLLITIPGLVGVSFLGSLIYGGRLPAISIVLGGLQVAFTSGAELPAVDLQGHELILRLVSITVIAELVACVAAALGAPFPVAMNVGAGGSFIALVATSPTSLQFSGRLQIIRVLRAAFIPSLMVTAVCSALIVRIPLLAAPLMLPKEQAGMFATIVSSLQYAGALLTTALYTIMAIRARSADKGDVSAESRMRRLERAYVGLSFAMTLILIVLTPQLLRLMSLSSYSYAAAIWITASLSVPFLVANRAVQYRWHAQKAHWSAAIYLAGIAALEAFIAFVSVALREERLLAASATVAEFFFLAAFSASVVILRRRAPRSGQTALGGDNPT